MTANQHVSFAATTLQLTKAAMSRFDATPTGLAGLMVLQRKLARDDRGQFGRLFCADDLKIFGWQKPIAQSNISITQGSGTVRGLHYQHPPHDEMKLVSCIEGCVYDVAVDIRANSKTKLQHFGVELSAENQKALLIPEGFAHGFQCLSERATLIYFHSAAFHAEAAGGLHPQDEKLAITWPLKIARASEKDLSYVKIDDTFKGVKR
jgi:dTDP-4-dehydrorhamnose 3,5-epimerase